MITCIHIDLLRKIVVQLLRVFGVGGAAMVLNANGFCGPMFIIVSFKVT